MTFIFSLCLCLLPFFRLMISAVHIVTSKYASLFIEDWPRTPNRTFSSLESVMCCRMQVLAHSMLTFPKFQCVLRISRALGEARRRRAGGCSPLYSSAITTPIITTMNKITTHCPISPRRLLLHQSTTCRNFHHPACLPFSLVFPQVQQGRTTTPLTSSL